MVQGRMIVHDKSMESNGECMTNDLALTTPEGGSRIFGVILGSYQRGRGYELNMKQQG